MKTKLLFVRHGRSQAAEDGTVQGQGIPVPLTPEGKEQAKRIAEHLSHTKFNRIFASTSRRAIETAEEIRKFHQSLPYEEIKEFNERSKGTGEGMKKEDFEKKYPDLVRQWKKEIDARPEGGENFQDVEKRVIPVLKNHLEQYAGETILYVIHGNVIRVILGHMLHIPFGLRARIEQGYCALNTVVFDHLQNRWIIENVNFNLGKK
jgi:broad specificity phosphatase PhoE